MKKLSTICKASISLLFINLYIVYTVTGSYIPMGTTIFGGVAVFCMVIDLLIKRNRVFNSIKSEIMFMTFFIIFAFIFSIFSVAGTTYTIKSIFQFCEKLLLVAVIYYICVTDSSIKFPLKVFALIAIAVSVYVLVSSEAFEMRVRLSDNISPNALGNLLVLGFFSLLMLFNDSKFLKRVIMISGSLLVLYILLLTGSRKSLYAYIAICVLYFIYAKRIFSSRTLLKSLAILLLLAVGFVLTFDTLNSVFENTSMYSRMFGEKAMHASESNIGRIYLYWNAFIDFLKNPLFGIGFNNYVYLHGSYTHSVYAEVLACTGILGVITYFSCYVLVYKKVSDLARTKLTEDNIVFQNRMLYILVIVFLFVGLGIGHMYDNISMVELGLLMAHCRINSNKSTKHKIEGDWSN